MNQPSWLCLALATCVVIGCESSPAGTRAPAPKAPPSASRSTDPPSGSPSELAPEASAPCGPVGCEAPRPIVEGSATPSTHRKRQEDAVRVVPPIDLELPALIETATFGLG